MSDVAQIEPTTQASSAGSLMRQARLNKGMHIATLASAIKVPQRKLELLEQDQWDELPDMAFARALAQTVCRTLQVDTAAVMALLPMVRPHRIEHLGDGLNAPFQERCAQTPPHVGSRMRHPAVWGSCLLLLAAAVLMTIPSHWLSWPVWMSQAAATFQDPQQGVKTESLLLTGESFASAALGPASGVDSALSPPLTSELDAHGLVKPLELRVSQPTLIEVSDGAGTELFSGPVQPKAPVFLEGLLPFRVRINHPASAEVRFRGQIIDLAPSTKDNVAYIELY